MSSLALKNTMNAITPIDEAAWTDFEQYFSNHSLKKGDLLWKEREVVNQVIFITKGSIRYYYTNEDGKDVTAQFFFENRILTDYYSFASQKPTDYNYQAVEDCEYISFPRVVMQQMFDKYKCFERLGRIIAESNFIGQQQTIREQKNISPEDKYLKLIQERPKVIARIPLHMIASYLAITPEHLSRIRKKLIFEK